MNGLNKFKISLKMKIYLILVVSLLIISECLAIEIKRIEPTEKFSVRSGNKTIFKIYIEDSNELEFAEWYVDDIRISQNTLLGKSSTDSLVYKFEKVGKHVVTVFVSNTNGQNRFMTWFIDVLGLLDGPEIAFKYPIQNNYKINQYKTLKFQLRFTDEFCELDYVEWFGVNKTETYRLWERNDYMTSWSEFFTQLGKFTICAHVFDKCGLRKEICWNITVIK